jgi:hypothetical protein
MTAILNAGAKAPDFSLSVNPDQKLTLSELRGKPVILAFYPADWSPVCGDQMALYNEILPEFQKYGAEGCRRPSLRGLPREGGILRTRTLCHRQRWGYSLELLLADPGQPGCRWNPAGIRRTGKIGGLYG